MVLLKNNGILPIVPHPGETYAVIGPNATTAQIMGGGGANSIRTIASRLMMAFSRRCRIPSR